jgi:hypothetical protein
MPRTRRDGQVIAAWIGFFAVIVAALIGLADKVLPPQEPSRSDPQRTVTDPQILDGKRGTLEPPSAGPKADSALPPQVQRPKPPGEIASSLYLPAGVTFTYVFFQEHGPEKSSPCKTHDAVPPGEFIARFEDYREAAKRENVRMIVTAQGASTKDWLQPDIRYRGHPLRIAFYTCNGFPALGAEVPLSD